MNLSWQVVSKTVQSAWEKVNQRSSSGELLCPEELEETVRCLRRKLGH